MRNPAKSSKDSGNDRYPAARFPHLILNVTHPLQPVFPGRDEHIRFINARTAHDLFLSLLNDDCSHTRNKKLR
jgi:hypothetical protein